MEETTPLKPHMLIDDKPSDNTTTTLQDQAVIETTTPSPQVYSKAVEENAPTKTGNNNLELFFGCLFVMKRFLSIPYALNN